MEYWSPISTDSDFISDSDIMKNKLKSMGINYDSDKELYEEEHVYKTYYMTDENGGNAILITELETYEERLNRIIFDVD